MDTKNNKVVIGMDVHADATDNMRIITDKDTIDYINATLMAWVKL